MKVKTLRQATRLYGEPVKVEDVNTNNNWGFGGWYGKRYTFANGFYFEKGRVSTRHQGTFPKAVLYNDKGLRVGPDGQIGWDE